MKAVLFDVGKVLVDFDYEAVAGAVTKLSKSTVPHLSTISGPFLDDYHCGRIQCESLHEFFVGEYETERDFERFEEAMCSSFSPIPEGIELFSTLLERDDVKVGIISDNHRMCERWMRRELPILFSCDGVILSQDVGAMKPDSKIYLSALSAVGLPPEQCFFIDDRENNIHGAKAVGMEGVVHLDWSTTKRAVADFLGSGTRP